MHNSAAIIPYNALLWLLEWGKHEKTEKYRVSHGVTAPRCGFPISKSHGAVRCGFYFLGIFRCGAVRFSVLQNHTVRVRCGADYIFQESHGAVRCGHPLNSCFLRCG